MTEDVNAKTGRPRVPLIDRFRNSYTICEITGCWVWHGSKSSEGYGRICEGGNHGRNLVAHRWAYLTFIGMIADGFVLDHLCRNTSCVNPAHLEPVTQRENVLRGVSIMSERAASDSCCRGHKLSGNNLYMNADGTRQCVRCRSDARRRHWGRNIDAERARSRSYHHRNREKILARQTARREALASARSD